MDYDKKREAIGAHWWVGRGPFTQHFDGAKQAEYEYWCIMKELEDEFKGLFHMTDLSRLVEKMRTKVRKDAIKRVKFTQEEYDAKKHERLPPRKRKEIIRAFATPVVEAYVIDEDRVSIGCGDSAGFITSKGEFDEAYPDAEFKLVSDLDYYEEMVAKI